jgi:hypothetical protein
MLTRHPSGYCPSHEHLAPVRTFIREQDNRPSPAARGYGADWRKIRERTLRLYGIPMCEWHKYDVHHDPLYDKAIEPDHSKYKLTPLLRSDHSSETAAMGGGFGNQKR